MGPDLPHLVQFPASVEHGDGLLLVGGLCKTCTDDSLYLNTVYELNPSDEYSDWYLRLEHTVTSAEALAAVIVEETQAQCQPQLQ